MLAKTRFRILSGLSIAAAIIVACSPLAPSVNKGGKNPMSAGMTSTATRQEVRRVLLNVSTEVKFIKDMPAELPKNEKELTKDFVQVFAAKGHVAMTIADLDSYNCLRFTLYVKESAKKLADYKLFVYEGDNGEIVLRPTSDVSKESAAQLASSLEKMTLTYVSEPETTE